MNLSPKTALLLSEDGSEKEIPTEQLSKGDLFIVKPGSLIPVDGVIEEGTSSVNEAAITGESIPVEKGPGDPVNLETDIIGKYVEKLMAPVQPQPNGSKLTRDFLEKYGF